MKQTSSYWNIFKETFLISAFTFGGGYVMLPLMQSKFVKELRWLEEKEVYDLFAIAQSAPGAIAINASIALGYRLKGIKGALLAVLATVLPPLVIISVISYFYIAFSTNHYVSAVLKGMQIAVAAIIIDVVWKMVQDIVKQRWIPSIVLMLLAFVSVAYLKINLIFVLVAVACLGLLSEKLFPRLTQKETK